DAGLGPEDLRRAALVLTYEAPGIDRLLRGFFVELGRREGLDIDPASFLRGVYERHREAVYHTHSFMHLHLLARVLGIHGPTLFLNNACASGLFALQAAADQLRLGRCEVALAAAAELPLYPTKHLWFEEAGVASPSGALRPFDRDRDGLVLGG